MKRGRKPVNTIQTSIWLNVSTAEKVKEVALMCNQKISIIVEMALLEFFKNHNLE